MNIHITLASLPLRTRIAPTPSGFLHNGNAFSFVLTWALARTHKGHLHLRIDDLDSDRVREEYIQDVFDSLAWLGLDYDSGPVSTDDFIYNWSQKRRLDLYHQALQRLQEKRAVYPCQCSRSTPGAFASLAEGGNIYTGLCRTSAPVWQATTSITTTSAATNIGAVEYAWRFLCPNDAVVRLDDANGQVVMLCPADCIGDVVVRRKDGLPAYHIASLIDDELDSISFIVRGADLLPSSAVQMLLAETLQLRCFPKAQFLHHPLLRDDKQQKLSKSRGASSLKALRTSGIKPTAIYQDVARYLGLTTHADIAAIQTPHDLLVALRG